MGTWNAFYVRGTSSEISEAIRKTHPDAMIAASAKFIGVALDSGDYTPPEQELSELSARLHTDVFWLSFQSVVDAFQFHHWLNGEHLRALVYGCYEEERTWERAEGTTEPWERTIFFPEERLEWALEDAAPREQAKLKRIWRERRVSAGSVQPMLDSRACAHEIAAFYGLPHYA